MVQIKLLHSSQKETWALVPKVEDRIRAFVAAYASDMNPEYLIQWLRMSFISNGPTSLTLAGVDEDGVVVGHAVALAEKWFGTNVVTLVQLEVDPGTRLTAEDWAQGEKALAAFAAYTHATHIQIAARNKAAARLFARHGFREGRVLMRRAVEGCAG